MLTVTDAARDHLSQLLSRTEHPEGTTVRVVPGQQGLELALDAPREGDATFEHDGEVVLTIDTQLSEMLEDKTLDIEQTDGGPQLKLE